jgi:hypothetical protein
MAIQVNTGPADETWAVFVRRNGDEGFCSDQQHILDDLTNDTFTFRLPWKPGATSVAMSPSTDFESRLGQASGALGVAQNQGVLLSFTMPTPPPFVPNQPWIPGMVNGELHLKWTVPANATGGFHRPIDARMAVATTGTRPSGPVIEVAEDEPEDRLGQLFTAMTPAQRLTLTSKAPQPPASHQKVALRMAAARPIATLPIRVARAHGPVARAVADPQKKAMDQKRLDALHAVYGAEIPGFSPRVRITPRPLPRVP